MVPGAWNMNILYIDIFVLVGALLIAPVLHLVIAYRIAPRRAKAAILLAMTSDPEFQSNLIRSLVENFSKPLMIKDSTGTITNIAPVDLFSKVAVSHFQAWFKEYTGGVQSSMMKDLERNADNAVQSMPDNPMIALALQQVPKKYMPYVHILANLLLQQRQT